MERTTVFPAASAAWARIARRQPDFLIIGAQKAGTTSLYHYLVRHPAIVGPSTGKEQHFFSLRYDEGLAAYLRAFPYRWEARGRQVFEATPDYLAHPQAADRVRARLGLVKLIVLLRDPAERAYSAWSMWHHIGSSDDPVLRRKEDRRTFREAIEAELAAPPGASTAPYHYLSFGRYAEHLERWRGLFGPERMLVLDYAGLRDLGPFLDRICDFLGLKPFAPGAVAAMQGVRWLEGTRRQRSPEEEATLGRLREYYEPYNRALKAATRIDFTAASIAA